MRTALSEERNASHRTEIVRPDAEGTADAVPVVLRRAQPRNFYNFPLREVVLQGLERVIVDVHVFRHRLGVRKGGAFGHREPIARLRLGHLAQGLNVHVVILRFGLGQVEAERTFVQKSDVVLAETEVGAGATGALPASESRTRAAGSSGGGLVLPLPE